MKETNNTISVLIPVHELNDITKQTFSNAVKSVESQLVKPFELLIIVPKGSDVKTFMDSFDFGSIKDITTIVENDGATDFCSQINLGVNKAKGEWFSILEFDDELSAVWFKNVKLYQEAYPEVKIFLPIIVDVDSNNTFIGLMNEASWANSFSDKFNIDGMVMNKETFEEFGGLKKNIKLTFNYEFLLRMTQKDVTIMTIPKFGCKHVNQREGSLFHTYVQTMNPVEANWWKDKAKKEQFFPKDREITYDEKLA